VRRTESFFDRWGNASLFIAKFVPGLSQIAPPLAGASRTGLLTFLFYDGLGAAVWAGGSIVLGRLFHHAIGRLLTSLESLGSWALVVVGALLALFILWRWYERRRFYLQLRMARIQPHELMELMNDGSGITVVDVRGERSRRRDGRSVPGAIALDPANIDATLSSLQPAQEIVLYCT
jgi:hypothetical protein